MLAADDFVGQRSRAIGGQNQLNIFRARGFGVCQVALLLSRCASQQVTAGPVHAQFAYVILFSAISSLALRDVNGERFRLQVGISRRCFNFGQGNR